VVGTALFVVEAAVVAHVGACPIIVDMRRHWRLVEAEQRVGKRHRVLRLLDLSDDRPTPACACVCACARARAPGLVSVFR
jgi:hypothetical protein